MQCWIFVFNPLERYMANYKHIFDAWEEGGVRGIVVGRMFFFRGRRRPNSRLSPRSPSLRRPRASSARGAAPRLGKGAGAKRDAG